LRTAFDGFTILFHPAMVPSSVENRNIAGMAGASVNPVVGLKMFPVGAEGGLRRPAEAQ
jgi:hypothetical protein